MVHLDDTGYRVRLVRGAGVNEARWKEVEDAVTATPRGVPCVILRLTDGRTTTIPVEALAADREEFVRRSAGPSPAWSRAPSDSTGPDSAPGRRSL